MASESLKGLYEQKKPLAAEIRRMADKLAAENRDFTAEEKPIWEKVNADYNQLQARIEAVERADAVESSLERRREPEGRKIGLPAGARLTALAKQRLGGDSFEAQDALRSHAFRAWCQAQYGAVLSDEDREVCEAVGLNPFARELEIGLYSTADLKRLQRQFREVHPSKASEHVSDFRATLSSGLGSAGGYLIAPEQLIRSLEINMLAFGGMRQVSDALRTASGERISWPTSDDTSNTGVQLGESTSIGSSVDPTMGLVSWDAYKFSSKPTLVPFELIQDSQFDIAGLIGTQHGERLGRITNTKFTNGTGATTPFGIIQKCIARSFTQAALAATAIAGDDLLNLVHSIDPAYRNGGGFMLHDSILLALRKLKDGNGMYLWQSGLREGAPDRLLGYGLTINQDMDSSIASGKYTILFGQLSKYKIRTVGSIRVYRLQERYRDTDQDGFVSFIREDGNLLDAGTAPLKVLSH